MLILACLRISAVIHDVEIRSEYYMDLYYKSVDRQDRGEREMMQSPTSNETTISTSTAQQPSAAQSNYILYEKIVGKLTKAFVDI